MRRKINMIRTLFFPAVLTTCFMSGALADTAAPDAPAFKTLQLGNIDLRALHDKNVILPNDANVLGVEVGEKAVADVLAAAHAPTDRIALSVDALFVKESKKNILIDTGLGPGMQGMLLQSLALAGYKPDQITDVLITHVHSDHIGGLVAADGKQAFPNAVVRISSPDWAWLQTQPDMAALVTAIKPQVKTFTPGDSVTSGIRSVSLKGHTPGHVGYLIASGQEHIFDIGDSAHSSIVSLVKPEWAISFDNNRAEGMASRKRVLVEAAADHTLIFSPHFPFPGIGYIAPEGEHYVFQPTR